MAYVNVLEWRSEQVAEWLQGLDDAIGPYVQFFINNNVTGQGLLNMTTEDLNKLHVEKIGHQELILEALEHLRNLHHNLDTENFQYICLRLSCKARSLCNEIRMCHPEIADSGYPSSTLNSNGSVGSTSNKQAIVSTETMSAVADVLDCLWTLISWLDRPPFNNNTNNQQHYYVEFKKKFCDIGLQLATSAQRDTFAENPVRKVLDCCKGLDDLSDTLIREVNDSLILQPASLDVAHVKKRSNSYNCGAEDANFGIAFEPFPLAGVHVINSVRFQSPAHQCDRIHPGDEIVQINYQTVIGWSLKKVCQLMEENPSEMTITLKKRPRHQC